jgi:hypothetical protein
MSLRWMIRGFVREAESGLGVPGLTVKAGDKEQRFDRFLPAVTTGDRGEFVLEIDAGGIQDFADKRPDVLLHVFGGEKEIAVSKEPLRWSSGAPGDVMIDIARERLGRAAPPREIVVRGSIPAPERTLHGGDSLLLQARGLRPLAQHRVVIADEQGEVFSHFIPSDAGGAIEPTVLWPTLGLENLRGGEPLPVEQELARADGKRITITLFDGDKVVAKSDTVVRTGDQPLVVGTDAKGRLRNGFEIGTADAQISLVHFPKGQSVRVWMVPRQHEWRPGDAIRPVTLTDGALAQLDVVTTGAARQDALMAKAPQLATGAYDFIVRVQRYGYEDDELVLRRDDVVGARNTTGLVVREPFMGSKVVEGGCINLQKISARYVDNVAPYIQYTDVFQVGEDVWGALDPLAVDPNHTGKAVAFYVVPHKQWWQWVLNDTLNNLPVLGGNANVQKAITQSWCVNATKRKLWPNAQQVGAYDIVADFGNNSASLATFVPDNQYNMPLDMIDGYIVPGFRIVPDPTTDTSYSYAGSLQYSEGTEGYVDVVDDYGSSWHVPLKAIVYFPANVAGATTVGQISPNKPSYPLVVVVHGNGPLGGYLGYNYLLEHLAKNGFIAASIHMQPNQTGTDRARVLRRHLQILFAKFGAKAANNIGIMGHSRGGEAVVIATRLNQQESWGYNINAVISLAPTNQYTFEHFGGAWAKPYLVIYGSLDGDLGGIADTGFELYDHASGMKKSMAFVYRSCHDRYNTVWGDGDLYFGELTAGDQARVLSAAAHHNIAMGYMAAFYRQYLRGETQWDGIFKGEWIPAAVSASDANMKIYVQYEDTTQRVVDNFDNAPWSTSDIGGAVTPAGLPATPVENDLRTTDPHSPHATRGLELRWDNTTDSLAFAIPAGQRNVTGYSTVSFRVSQKVNAPSNPAGMPQDMRLKLTDAVGKSRSIRVSKFAEIPAPDPRGYDVYTKSAMRTVRIPLSAYTIKCLGVDSVDLTNVTRIDLLFSQQSAGDVEIDSVQFTN